MQTQLMRTELLLGEAGIEKLSKARVAVFGIGGVGGYVTEALCRSGVGALDLIDHDTVSVTNLNRQVIALHSTVQIPFIGHQILRMMNCIDTDDISRHVAVFLPVRLTPGFCAAQSAFLRAGQNHARFCVFQFCA